MGVFTDNVIDAAAAFGNTISSLTSCLKLQPRTLPQFLPYFTFLFSTYHHLLYYIFCLFIFTVSSYYLLNIHSPRPGILLVFLLHWCIPCAWNSAVHTVGAVGSRMWHPKNLAPQSVSLWHENKFRLIIFKRQKSQEVFLLSPLTA